MSKIERTFVNDVAYKRLKEWIVIGQLAPGVKLKDKELAEKLGVSRTPIREALLKLENEGFVKTEPNKATQVTQFDLAEAKNLYSIVWTLEKFAARSALPYITPQVIEKLEKANAKFLSHLKQHKRLESLQADIAFHSIWSNLARNPDLVKILADLKSKLMRIDLFYFQQVDDIEASYLEHEAIIQAFKKADPVALEEAIENNWLNSFNRINL
ncbi:MAG: HTH-type transcriptional repressor RspR [Chlamydiia bacterium]|nr:HTH-type transcriptional repressor RspR [Chlamydiia bacterium]